MVFGGISDCGKKNPLVVIPQGVKVNKEAYIGMMEDHIKPWIDTEKWENGYTWMQDGAPAHTANLTQRWLHDNLEDFWPKEMWPPSSPDLNPMDFSM